MTTWNNANKSSAKLSIESLKSAFDYLYSDECEKEIKEKVLSETKGMMILNQAYEDGNISEVELIRLMMSVKINGALIVSQRMKNKILGADHDR